MLAIIGATVAALGNAGATWLSGRWQSQLENSRALSAQANQEENNKSQLILERMKADSERILEMVKTSDPEKAATNLAFLVDTGLIENPDTAKSLRIFLGTRKVGQGPSLPSTSSHPKPVQAFEICGGKLVELRSRNAATVTISASGRCLFQVGEGEKEIARCSTVDAILMGSIWMGADVKEIDKYCIFDIL